MADIERRLAVWVVAFDTAPGWDSGVCGYDWVFSHGQATDHFRTAVTWDPNATMVVLSPLVLETNGKGLSLEDITELVGDVERGSDVLWETWSMRYLPPPPEKP